MEGMEGKKEEKQEEEKVLSNIWIILVTRLLLCYNITGVSTIYPGRRLDIQRENFLEVRK